MKRMLILIASCLALLASPVFAQTPPKAEKATKVESHEPLPEKVKIQRPGQSSFSKIERPGEAKSCAGANSADPNAVDCSSHSANDEKKD